MATLYLFQLNIDFLETKLLPLPMAGHNGFMSNSWEKETRLFFVTAKNICRARVRPSVGQKSALTINEITDRMFEGKSLMFCKNQINPAL